MNLSIIVVSRKRHEHLKDCLHSIRENFGDVELYLGYDQDDPETREIGKDYQANLIEGLSSPNRHSQYINPIALKCKTDFVLSLNDDTIIQHLGDCSEILKKHGLIYGICEEVWPCGNAKEDWEKYLGHRYACYPLVGS